MRLLTTAAKKLLADPRFLLACLLLSISMAVSAQEKTVSGVVKNAADGSPIANASVQLKGTKSGSLTNDQGAYSIKVNNNQTLAISAVGFTPVEIKVGSQTVINVEMENINKEMEAVVVTALGITRQQKALGFSQQQINADDVNDARSNNWSSAL